MFKNFIGNLLCLQENDLINIVLQIPNSTKNIKLFNVIHDPENSTPIESHLIHENYIDIYIYIYIIIESF